MADVWQWLSCETENNLPMQIRGQLEAAESRDRDSYLF